MIACISLLELPMMRGCLTQYFYSMDGRIQCCKRKYGTAVFGHSNYIKCSDTPIDNTYRVKHIITPACYQSTERFHSFSFSYYNYTW